MHHGDDAYERKLRPVYDALDARSYKQAIKLADAALKKYKADQLLRALKAYALYRVGKQSEGLQLVHDIVAEGPEADRVVMTMAYTFKAAGQAAAIAQAYAVAAEKHPRDIEILGGLYKAHVRDFSFVKQQQVATRLSKLLQPGPDRDRCAWWVVCALALQARAGLLRRDERGCPLPAGSGGGLPPDKLMQLAETMAARQASAGAAGGAPPQPAGADHPPGGFSYEGLLLYLDILHGQGKAAEALQAVEGPHGSVVPLPADRLQLRAAALVRLGDLPAAAALYHQAVSTAPDDWLSWQLHLDCLLPGSRGDSEGGSIRSKFPVGVVGGLADAWDRQQPAPCATGSEAGSVAAALEAAEASACQLSAEVAASEAWAGAAERGTLRAPHLWRCELALRAARLHSGGTWPPCEAQQRRLAHAVAEAFPKLAANFSCAPDLRPYLSALTDAPAEQLAAAAHAAAVDLNAADGGGGAAGEVRRLQRLVNAHQLELELGLPRFTGPEPAAAHASRLLGLYRAHVHLSDGLDEKERGYGEHLVAGAVEALVAAAALEMAPGTAAASAAAEGSGINGAAVPERAVGRLLQAALVLEGAQRRRRVSAPLRLAATALYGLLGAPKLAAKQFAALDIKSVLHDSLTGHWLLPLLAGGPTADADLRSWVDGAAALHETQAGDAGDTLGIALEHCTYSKVAEFVDFKERLQHSHTRALAAAARALLLERGGGAGPRAALRHAAALLAAGEAAGEGGEAAGCATTIRFNDDLSTRPSWLPPGSSTSSAVADWWRCVAADAAAGTPRAGYARCWWAAPGAAEVASAPAAAWRRDRLRELRVTVGWALAAGASLASADDAAALLCDLGTLPAARPDGSLRAVACAAAEAALQALVGTEAADGAGAMRELAAACGGAAQRAVAELAAVQGLPVLPGSVPAVAAATSADCRRVGVVCGRLHTLAAAAPGCAALAAAARAAAEAAANAVAAVAAASGATLEAAGEEERVERAMALVDACGGSAEPLWAFEPALDPRPAVAALVGAQLTLLRSTQT